MISLTFRPIEANLTHNTDIFSRMNPYCCFLLGDQKFTGEICRKGGKRPTWSDSITIPYSPDTPSVLFELWDKDKITNDDIIGTTTIDLTDLQNIGKSKRWYPLTYKNKPAGEILIEASLQDAVSPANTTGLEGNNEVPVSMATSTSSNDSTSSAGSFTSSLPEGLQTFIFRPLEAKLTHNTDILSKMSPYVTFVLENERIEGPVCPKGAKNPVWDTEIAVPIVSNATMILCEVMDKDRISSDDLIGSCLINLATLQAQGGLSKSYPLTYHGRPAGELVLEGFLSGSKYDLSAYSSETYSTRHSYMSGKVYISGQVWEGSWSYSAHSEFFTKHKSEADLSQFYMNQRPGSGLDTTTMGSPSNNTGLETIVFRPMEATLTHDTDLITKMSPYVAFVLGDERIEGPVCPKGSKNPVWNVEIAVPLTDSAKMILCEVMDKDKITSDDLVGSCLIDLSELQPFGGQQRMYPLTYKGKPAGELLLECFVLGSSYAETAYSGGPYGTGSDYRPGQAYVGGKAWEKAVKQAENIEEPQNFTEQVKVSEQVPAVENAPVTEKMAEVTEKVTVKKTVMAGEQVVRTEAYKEVVEAREGGQRMVTEARNTTVEVKSQYPSA